MAVTTTTTLDDLVQAIIGEARMWFQQASLFFPKQGVAEQFLMVEDLSQVNAVSHTFPMLGSVAFGDAVEGNDYVNTSALTTSGVTVTAARKVLNIPVSDLVAMSNTRGEAYTIALQGKAAGLAAAKKFDGDVCAVFSSLGSTPTGGNATNSPMTAAEFRNYITALQTAEIPGPYAAIWHPWGYKEFLDESSSPILNAAASGDIGRGVWKEFWCGNLFGVDMFQSPRVVSDGTDYQGAFMSPNAIGVTWKRGPQLETERDASAGHTEFVRDMYYGVGVVDATAGYVMLQDAD